VKIFVEKNTWIIANFSIASIGDGQTSLGRYVAAAVKAFNDIDGLDYDVTVMGTIHSTKD